MINNRPEEELDTLLLVEEQINKRIIIYNDDVNSFDHVIDCLMQYCNHEPEQAEQCSLIIHFRGKCDVKSGSYEILEPICDALLINGLSAEIE